MELTRRNFLKSTVTLAAITVSGSGMLLLEGCPVSQSQLAQLAAELGTALAGILPYIKGVSATLAKQAETDFQALSAAIQAWKSGSVITEIEEATNAFVAVMAQISPILAVYAPEVAFIVSVVENIITLLVPNAVPPSSMATVGFVEAARRKYPHPPKTAREVRSKWNSLVKAENHPELVIN